MADLSSCMAIANAMAEADRDALVARVDAYMDAGMPPGEAQRMATADMLAESSADLEELLTLAQQQNPDDAPEAEPPAPEPPRQEPIQFAKDEPPKRRRQESTRATVAAGRIRRSVAELADLASSMEVWRDWYELHEDSLVELFGRRDAQLFLRLLSITSQASTVASNFALAIKAYEQWYEGVPFKGYLPGVRLNLERLRLGEDIRGPKITQYGSAVMGYEGGIAVDRHIAMLMFNVVKPNKAQRNAAMDRINEIAERLSWSPREVQSALWAYNQFRLGTAPDEVATYAKLADRHRERIAAAVRAAKDTRRAQGSIRPGREAAAGAAEQRGAARRGDSGAEGPVAFSRDDPFAGLPADNADPTDAQDAPRKAPVYTHEVIDPRNGNRVMGKYQSVSAARRGQDRLDNKYGAYRYAVREIPGALTPLSVPPGGYTLRDFGRWGALIERIQDRYNRWTQVLEDVRAQGGIVNVANDFFRAEERYWGKVGSRVEDFRKEVKGWVEAVTADGLTLQDVAMYAYAQHAKERNDHVAAKRPGMPDGGSGMTTATAQAILDTAQLAGIDAKLQAHTATMRAWIQGTRDLALDEGLITDDEWMTFTGMFQNYIPLRGLEKFEAQRMGTGQGMTAKGVFSREAKGRYSEAKNQIEQVVEDRIRTLIRAGKNEVVRTFAQFMADNYDPELWEFSKTERKPVYVTDGHGNTYLKEKDVLIADDRTIVLKDGGEDVYITVKDEALFRQLKNLNAEQVGVAVGALLAVNRLLGKLYTTFSPVFTVVNAARDIATATFGVIDEIGFMGVPKLYANLPKAMWQSSKYELDMPSADYQLYRATGGKTGFFDYKDIDAQAEELASWAKSADRSLADPRKFGPKVAAMIEGANSAIENATRFAAFQTARQSGKTVAEAASIAKNITVNFNRKGTMTPGLSAYFLFFNPAIQGSARMIEALKNPKVLATLGFAMGGVLALALRNAGMGEDDDGVPWWDKIPNEVKERNLIIIHPPGVQAGEPIEGATREARYTKIPMPYGYNFFAVVANQIADVWRNGQNPRHGRTAGAAVAQAAKAFGGSWLPMPELGRSITSEGNPDAARLALLLPDAVSPMAQVWSNTNPFGRQLRPDDQFSETKPDSQTFFPGQAGTIFQKTAQELNERTGGNAFVPGLLDIAPSTLETLLRGYGGGIASFALDTMNAIYVRHSVVRPEVDVDKLPFRKQLTGVINDETDRLVSSERMDEVRKKAEPFARAVKDGDAKAVERMLEEYGPGMAALGDVIQGMRKSLATLRDAELQAMEAEGTDAEKFQRIQELAKQRRKLLQQFNAAYDQVVFPEVSAPKAP